jgi:prepilin-type N-terminal cleavage/methylation domain-containing protein
MRLPMTLADQGTGRGDLASRLGFTLVEVLVVLLIVAITAAVAVPNLARATGGGAGADAVARDLVEAYHAARDAAASRGAPATVTLELRSGSYWITIARSAAAKDTLRHGALPLTPSTRLSGGHDGWAETTFDPLGRSRNEPVMVAEGEDRYEVTVDAWTAAVDVRRP